MALRELDCGLCTRRWCAILKENALFSFIQTGAAVLIAPGDRLVGFGPTRAVLAREPIRRIVELKMEGFTAAPCPGCDTYAVTVLGLQEGSLPPEEPPDMTLDEWEAEVERLLKDMQP